MKDSLLGSQGQPYMKKALTGPHAAIANGPKITAIVDGTAQQTYTVKPMASAGFPHNSGTMLLVPTPQRYWVLVYVAGEEGPLEVKVPGVAGILVMELPDGWETPKAAIDNEIKDHVGEGQPSHAGAP